MPQPHPTSFAFKSPLPGSSELSVLGITLQTLASSEQTSDQFSVYSATFMPGMFVPLHHHVEAECHYILEGTMQVFIAEEGNPHWLDVRAGESVTIPSQAKHALRNVSEAPAHVLEASTASHGRFLEAAGVAVAPGGPPLPPTPESIGKMMQAAVQSGMVMASPEENAAIGLKL